MTIQASKQQDAILRYRDTANICSSGTRGSQKSTALLLDVIDRCRQYGEACRPLLVRESHPALAQLSESLYLMAHEAFNGEVTRNKAEGNLRMGNGALVQMAHINDIDSIAKHIGASYCSNYFDELGNYRLSSIEYCDMLRASLRPPRGMRAHTHVNCNPNGLAHTHVLGRYMKDPDGNLREFWAPYKMGGDAGPFWVNTHTSFRSNEFLDVAAYEQEIIAACHGSEAMLDAWLHGRWSMVGGSLLAPPFDYAVHKIDALPDLRGAPVFWAGSCDWGLSSPSALLVGFKVKQPLRGLPVDSIIIAAEDDTCVGGRYDVGDGSPPAVVASMMQDLLASVGAPPGAPIVTDDMRGLGSAEDTVIQHFRTAGLSAIKPNKSRGRVNSWITMRQLFFNAVQRNGGPVLLIHESCEGLLATLPAAPRDPKRPGDCDKNFTMDHHLDSAAMLVNLFTLFGGSSGSHVGMY